MESCQTCKFWKQTGYDGLCKRHAPGSTYRNGVNVPFWPDMDRDNWCGDYIYKPPEYDDGSR